MKAGNLPNGRNGTHRGLQKGNGVALQANKDGKETELVFTYTNTGFPGEYIAFTLTGFKKESLVVMFEGQKLLANVQNSFTPGFFVTQLPVKRLKGVNTFKIIIKDRFNITGLYIHGPVGGSRVKISKIDDLYNLPNLKRLSLDWNAGFFKHPTAEQLKRIPLFEYYWQNNNGNSSSTGHGAIPPELFTSNFKNLTMQSIDGALPSTVVSGCESLETINHTGAGYGTWAIPSWIGTITHSLFQTLFIDAFITGCPDLHLTQIKTLGLTQRIGSSTLTFKLPFTITSLSIAGTNNSSEGFSVASCNYFLNYIITNRLSFNNSVAKTYNNSAQTYTPTGTFTLPSLGTYAGNIHDLTEAQITNLIAGLDYTGSGTSTAWTPKEGAYILQNLQISSVNTTKRYRWTFTF